MYESVTRGVRVRVNPRYLPERSDPDESRYFWAYTIEIMNEGARRVQLRSRAWTIVDARGHVETVAGPGVVGEEPRLEPGAQFEYTSGCPLATSSGFMVGTYTMEDADGERFEVAIPAFSLDLPDERRVLN